jgi:asparaginyl-tRNA synthetase
MARIARIRRVLEEAADRKQVEVRGWVKSKRTSKNLAFVIINDGSMQADLQVVVEGTLPNFSELERVNTGAAVGFTGSLKSSPGKGQQWELLAASMTVFGEAHPDHYPLQKKGHTLEFLRDIAHLRPRTNTFGAVFRIRNVLSQLVHEFFQKQGFMWVHTPILTSSDCEGAGEMFTVTTLDPAKFPKSPTGAADYTKDFFGRHAHLTVSGQLEGEIFAQAFRDIYTFGPTFRAENSNTSRHLAEFWMIEPEMAFADLNDDMDLAEAFLKHLCAGVLRQCVDELGFFESQYKTPRVEELQSIVSNPFHRISYTEAVKILTTCGQSFEFPVAWGTDLQSEHERYLTDTVFKGPVIVTDYPKDIKAFYMRLNDDEKTVRAMDVLVPRVGEIVGGSQREERYDQLVARMEQMNIPSAELYWYLDLRRFGSTPHCGFGAGFERLVQYVTGVGNIRDVIPFPRFPGHISF